MNTENKVPFLVFLEECVVTSKIFLDASSWMQPSIEKFEDYICPLLYKHNASLVVPVAIYDEICRGLECGDPSRKERADRALRVMGRLQEAGFIRYYQDKDDHFGDSLLDSLFRKKRGQCRLTLITNDYKLGMSIRDGVNNITYGFGFPAVVKALAEDGTFMEVEEIRKASRADGRASGSAGVNQQTQTAPAFRMAERVTDIPDTPLPVSGVPGKGDSVLVNGKKVILGDVIGEGGEGIVYRCSVNGAAVKIYHREQITLRRQEKLRRMTSVSLDREGIVWPLCTAEKDGVVVGFLMREIENGVSLEDAMFNITALKENHPDWTRRNTAAIAVDILEKVRFLHANHVLLGDVKADNFVLCGDKIWITDCDSLQIEEFPCPVATDAYTPPELQDRECGTFLRTLQNEYFSLAILIFMVAALPGKSPYAHAGGSSPAENIRKMKFPYPLGEKSSESQPGGMWIYLWSHLPYRIKSDFYKTFTAGEEFSAEGSRLDTEHWYRSMLRYLNHDLDRMVKNDPMSESLFPTRFKKHRDMVYGKCEGCGAERSADFLQKHGGYCFDCFESRNLMQCTECGGWGIGPKMKEGLCYDCYRKKHETQCSCCGSTVLDTQLTGGFCRECLDKPHHTIKCSACPRTFEFSNRDYLYYREQGFVEPKQCPDCRKIRKQAGRAYHEAEQDRRKHCGESGAVKPVQAAGSGLAGTIQSFYDRIRKI